MYPLADGLFAPRNQWYVAAWSREVTRKPMERWVLDEPVAFYRKEDGAAVAVAGRCPHRSFPLGKSRVIGDNIQCGYHGITFQPDGSCARVPSQKAIPNACRIKSYPLAERWKWIWIWPGDPAAADESLIPDHFEIGLTDPSYHCAGDLYNFVDGRYMLMHDNLFDLTHLNYLHKDTFGGVEGTEMVPECLTGPGWVGSRYAQRDVYPSSRFMELLNYRDKVDVVVGLKLLMPCLHVGGGEHYYPATHPRAGQLLGAEKYYHAITPATRHTTHYFYGAGRTWEHPDPDHSQKLVDGVDPGLKEDVYATENIERMIQHYGGRPGELLLRADNVCARGRRFFETLIRKELEPQSSQASERVQLAENT